MIRPFTLLTVVLAASSGAYLFAVKHRAQVLDDQLATIAQQSRLDGQRIRVLQAQWALEIDPTRLTHLASQFTTLQPVKPAQLVTLAALRQVLPPPGAGAPEPNPEEPMPVQLDNPAPDTPVGAFSTTVAANGLPLPPPTPPNLAAPSLATSSPAPARIEIAAAGPSPGFAPAQAAAASPLLPPSRPATHRVRSAATRIAQNVTPPVFGAARSYDSSSLPPPQPLGAQLVAVRAAAATSTAIATATTPAAPGGSMLGMAQDALAPPQPLGTDN